MSPSKRSIAYWLTTLDDKTNTYRGSIRILHLGDHRIQSYTHGTARDSAPQWSADGTKLFFLSDRGGATQLWYLDVAGGEPVVMPAVPGNASEFAVSPDGLHVAVITTPTAMKDEVERRGWRRISRMRFRADGPGYFDDMPQLWLITIGSGSARPVTDGSGWIAAAAWDTAGQTIAFSAEHGEDADSLWHRELWTSSAANGWRARKILQFGSAIEAPAWSPDGSQIAFCGIAEADGAAGLRNMRLFSVDRSGENARCLTSNEEWTCGNFVLTDVGSAGSLMSPAWISEREIAVLGSSRGAVRIFRVSEESHSVPLTPAALSASQFATIDRETAVFCASDAVTPPELYQSNAGGEAVRLTRETEAWCADLAFASPAFFRISGPAGEIDAWHVEGSAPNPHPCILQIHGGPHYAYGNAFVFEFQLLAAAGYDVVYCNPRGSQSYGEAFAATIKGDWAAPAYDDCMAVLDHALDQFAIDPRHLGVAGGSYGGYLAVWAIGHTSRFAAAIAMRPATNLVTLWGTSEVGRMLGEELGGRPADNLDVYRRSSPLTYADAIMTPLLIIHSENDYRCPTEQAEQLFTALRQRGATVELLRFIKADHNLSRTGPPQQRVARLAAIVEWFDRFLAAPT